MWYRRLFYPIMIGTLFSQSIYHSYGVGLSQSTTHVSSYGLSVTGLVPSFRRGISLDNPATWPRLKSTFVNSSFRNLNIREATSNTLNQATGLSSTLFVIPIKEKYAFGLSLAPVTNQQIFLQEDSTLLLFGPDSLVRQKSARAGGGVSAFSFALSFPFERNSEAGLKVNYLFGSARNEYSLRVNEVEYRQFYRLIYNGMTLNGYLNTTLKTDPNYEVRLYSSVLSTIKPLRADIRSFQPYEDTNGNYYYDNADYPNSLAIDTSAVQSVFAPSALSLGVGVIFKENYHFSVEFERWKDQSLNGTELSLFRDSFDQINRFGVGWVKFPSRRPKEWYQKLVYRAGLHRSTFQLTESGRKLNEVGLSLGIGFKFGPAGNQIDLAYKFGSRSLTTNHNEAIQEFAVEISLGDVWFSKRRVRK